MKDRDANVEVQQRRKIAAEAAARLPRARDRVGLGTGRTAALVVDALAARAKAESLSLTCVSTSRDTEARARAAGLTVVAPEELPVLDIAIDGADEVDRDLDLVKGLGGALVRERLVERTASRLVIVVDDEKPVDLLGRGKIPVEIVAFGAAETMRRLEALGAAAVPRADEHGAPWTTENGNWIADLVLTAATRATLRDRAGKRALATAIKLLPGVVDHGLFLDMATDVLVGHADGTVEHRRK